jgi:hypothetical protein
MINSKDKMRKTSSKECMREVQLLAMTDLMTNMVMMFKTSMSRTLVLLKDWLKVEDVPISSALSFSLHFWDLLDTLPTTVMPMVMLTNFLLQFITTWMVNHNFAVLLISKQINTFISLILVQKT